MTRFGRFLLGSLTLGALAVSTRWTILPWTPGTFDFMYVSAALGALWTGLVTVALLKLGRRGLWTLAGAPLVMWWPIAFAVLQWTCMHGFDCM